jgi:zinc protease
MSNLPAINTTILPNGLTILTRELHHAPVISFWVWYRVGSRNELPGRTGVSHWVEHMLFKGTERYPKGTVDRAIARVGGTFNAMTWLDFTAYYSTLPADQIQIGLEIEADRMVNAAFDPAETEAERTVIIEERRMYENQPSFRLSQELQATAFQLHPYRHETIGWEHDLRHMTREDLYGHYRGYYTPRNAIVVAVGDFDTGRMVEQIESYFGGIEGGFPPQSTIPAEPTQWGERRVTVHGKEPTPRLTFAYRAPAVSHPDYWAMMMMDAVLTGAKVGMFGGGTQRTSRLYRRLVDGELAISVGSGLLATIDPFLYTISVALLPTSDPLKVETILEEEIARLQTEMVEEEILQRLKKQMRAKWAMGMESMSAQGRWLGLSATIASIEWFTEYLTTIETVTPDHIRTAAQTYLLPQKRTVGWYKPE